MPKTKIIRDSLSEEGYSSSDELVKDWASFVALSRIEQYRSEKEYFEERYGMSLQKFEEEIHAQKGFEDFQHEGDLEDWEFACKALRGWEDKFTELQRA